MPENHEGHELLSVVPADPRDRIISSRCPPWRNKIRSALVVVTGERPPHYLLIPPPKEPLLPAGDPNPLLPVDVALLNVLHPPEGELNDLLPREGDL